VTIVFILLVAFLPIRYAVISSIVWGISLLSVLSYFIAKQQRINPYSAIFQHVAIAAAVIIVSNFLGVWITKIFSKS
jgi:VIT1/CCC1 family predicted Fe2+/Mn2+ transporter